MPMTPSEIREALDASEITSAAAFSILRSISALCHRDSTAETGRELVIRALGRAGMFDKLSDALDSLVRQVGLFPYNNPDQLSTRDRLAFEYHRPLKMRELGFDIVFHREQAEVYRSLMAGRNVILSAPTSFGKSVIVDALLASGRFTRVVVIVPTIALIDETRRRLSKFRGRYKVITHPSQEADGASVFVLTQERAVDRADLKNLDLLIIDEFYKLDIGTSGDRDRATILNHAFYKLRKHARQVYLLGPNIHGVPEGFNDAFQCDLKITNYNTVVSDIHFIAPKPDRVVSSPFLRPI